MKTSFALKNGTAETGNPESSAKMISFEAQYLGRWANKIAERLGYQGEMKVIHQDHQATLACSIDETFTGNGQQVSDVAVCYSHLLKTV